VGSEKKERKGKNRAEPVLYLYFCAGDVVLELLFALIYKLYICFIDSFCFVILLLLLLYFCWKVQRDC